MVGFPTTERRDHKVIFVKKEMSPIWITEHQANLVRAHQGLWITIRENPLDSLSPIVYDGKKINIDQIIPIDWHKVQEIQGLRYINDFGESRLIVDMDTDDSFSRYKCPGLIFQTYVLLKFGIEYAQDLPNDKREQFLSWAKNKSPIEVSNLLVSEIRKLRDESL